MLKRLFTGALVLTNIDNIDMKVTTIGSWCTYGDFPSGCIADC